MAISTTLPVLSADRQHCAGPPPADPALIGGMFGLHEAPCNGGSSLGWLERSHLLVANARSGIHWLIEHLRPRRTWMPSYLCRAMLDAVDPRYTTLEYYEVDYDLAVTSTTWLDRIEQGDLVVLIDYFGFPCDAACVAEAQRRGATVLEDASQALLSSHVGTHADYTVFSLRKFLGVPDGGILVSNKGAVIDDESLGRPPADWWDKSLKATTLRQKFDIHGGDRRWFELFQEVEASCPTGPYVMSNLTAAMLKEAFCFERIAERRRENYQCLLERIGHLAVFRELPPGVVPLGFPIRCPKRDRLRQHCFDAQIFPPVHWAIQDFVPPQFQDSHALAADIMTLPCDQRYGPQEMDRMAACINANSASPSQ